MSASDPDFDRARRPMDRAFQRINAAATDADFEDELSCLLHHFYRFSEFCWQRLGYADRGKFYEWLHQSGDRELRAAGAMTWARPSSGSLAC